MKNGIILLLFMVLISASCKEEEPKQELPDISVIDVSQESEWNYCVLGKSDYYFIKSNGSTPEAVYFHSSEANKNYSINFTPNGFLDKVMVDDYVFSFRNPDGNKIDIGVLYPNGDIEILRGVETDYSWDNYAAKSTQSVEAWSDVIRWTGRIVAGVPCGISAATAVSTGGIATPLALWSCGNYILSLSADIAENEFGIHNGFTEFVNVYGNTQTAFSCFSGELLDCYIDNLASAISDRADRLEELENREDDLHVMESALEYGHGDMQITLTWDNNADLDLHVVDPNSDEIFFGHPYSNSGGILDVDDIDGYGPENIYWPQNEAPNGNYQVYVHHYPSEDPGYPTTSNYTVLVNTFGHIQKFTGTISLDETVYVADYDQTGLKSIDLKSTRSITKAKK